MTKVVAIMSMSLDGYVADTNDGVAEVFDWYFSGDVEVLTASASSGMTFRVSAPSADHLRSLVAEIGAMLTGRRTFDNAGQWAGDHHDGVPIFVLTRSAPDEPPPGSARYVTDVGDCVAQATAAAGDRDVLLHGAATAQACLRAGLLDEMELQVVPVLLGQGRRLFEDMPPDHVELQLVRVLDGPGVQHLRYRVRKAG